MTTERSNEDRSHEDTDQIRKVLAEGFSFVRGAETTEAVSSASFEESLALAIKDIEDEGSDIRPGKLSALRSLRQRVLDAIAQAREMPAEMFRITDGGANTRADGSGPTGEE